MLLSPSVPSWLYVYGTCLLAVSAAGIHVCVCVLEPCVLCQAINHAVVSSDESMRFFIAGSVCVMNVLCAGAVYDI